MQIKITENVWIVPNKVRASISKQNKLNENKQTIWRQVSLNVHGYKEKKEERKNIYGEDNLWNKVYSIIQWTEEH